MLKKIFITLILGLALAQPFYPIVVSAQKEYTVLAPLPGTYKGENKTDIKTYIEGLFSLLIALSAVFAVFMIVIGGFQYMTSDAIGGKNEGRARIENSIKGLILVIGAWLILAQIDERLLTVNIDITAANVPAPAGRIDGGTAYPGTGSSCVSCTSLNNNTGLNLSQNVQNWCERTSEGCFLNQDLVNKLKNLPGLTITEAWPPSRHHQNACHRNATCVDGVIGNMTDVNTIKNFINTAVQNGVNPVFETYDKDLERRLIEAGVPSSNIDTRWPRCTDARPTNCITGPHFSLYN